MLQCLEVGPFKKNDLTLIEVRLSLQIAKQDAKPMSEHRGCITIDGVFGGNRCLQGPDDEFGPRIGLDIVPQPADRVPGSAGFNQPVNDPAHPGIGTDAKRRKSASVCAT